MASMTLEQRAALAEQQRREEARKNLEYREDQRGSLARFAERRAAELEADPYFQLFLALNGLLSDLGRRGLQRVAAQQKQIEERFGLRIELVEGWQLKLPADPDRECEP